MQIDRLEKQSDFFCPSRADQPLKLAFCLITVRKHDGCHRGAGGERVITQYGGVVWISACSF